MRDGSFQTPRWVPLSPAWEPHASLVQRPDQLHLYFENRQLTLR
jgi:hypothetical protein